VRLRDLDAPFVQSRSGSLWIDDDGSGELYIRSNAGPETLTGQAVMPDAIDLIAPFTTREGLRAEPGVAPATAPHRTGSSLKLTAHRTQVARDASALRAGSRRSRQRVDAIP
jgi:hypothetical protein